MKTIEIDGYFGKKRIKKKDFIKRWTDHVQELMSLSYYSEDVKFFKETEEKVKDIAAKRFDEFFKRESKKSQGEK